MICTGLGDFEQEVTRRIVQEFVDSCPLREELVDIYVGNKKPSIFSVASWDTNDINVYRGFTDNGTLAMQVWVVPLLRVLYFEEYLAYGTLSQPTMKKDKVELFLHVLARLGEVINEHQLMPKHRSRVVHI